jgi:hypothetical protein
MQEAEVKAVPELQQLPILDERDPLAQSLMDATSAGVIAETVDTLRLFELLHRAEYRPVAAVRFEEAEAETESIRVYFRLLI